MKPPTKDDALILTKEQVRKVFLVTSILTISLYLVAMVFSLCGSKYFILNYQNEQMDQIENFFQEHKIMPLLSWVFTTIEFFIVCSFVCKKITRIWYVLAFYGIAMIISAIFPQTPIVFYQIYPFVFYLTIPLVEQLILTKKINGKIYLKQLIRLLIAIAITLLLQFMILIIKTGSFDGKNHIQTLSSAFIYAIEYDIALSVIFYTISLYIDGEKGDNKLWATYHNLGGSSQISMMPSQKSNTKKNLTKTQRNKLRLLYARMYLVQLGTLLLVMVLPFLLGKVFEFAVMYLSFAIVRYILGFNYSLHFKKEALCVSASLIVFGILSLVVPFFYIVLVVATF